MIKIPFAKLHGAENDFLLTWATEAPAGHLPEIARRICARNTGIGADGWMLVSLESSGLSTRLFNSDGSEAEISGNGTRCAAVFGLLKGAVTGPNIEIATAAGTKRLRVIHQNGNSFLIEMNMGQPLYKADEISTPLVLSTGSFDATILNVGNPQCAIFVDTLPLNWRKSAAEAEAHPRFPNRSNVSFVTVRDAHSIDAVFYERGAGETRSSGTGSTGAGVAAMLREKVQSPVEVRTPAGSMTLRWDDNVYLTGPTELTGEGTYFLDHRNT
ncbi:MAG: diaminopimelate epimerase [Bryobacteraceae bacterium]